jgi:hypothetical protein
VGVVPRSQHASDTALQGDVLPSHDEPSILVLDQCFGFIEA